MNKFDRFFIKYVIYSLPAVIAILIWGSIGEPDQLALSKGATRFFWDTLGWIFMLWIVISFYLSLRTVISRTFRDAFLSKVTRVKERDEREKEISGNAAKFSFFSTLAVLFLFLFLSLFTVTIGRYPKKEISQDKTGYISLGMKFEPYSVEKSKTETTDKEGKVIVNYSDLPLSNAGLLLILILWQIGGYHLVARKELRS
ncbi:MAG: hypothetical protein HON90_03330 [Halobacteriovoraceae bacterium]|jgi:hypothetical protein|nr:hypothetical protein [Halobacteriovoraceae bacterium]